MTLVNVVDDIQLFAGTEGQFARHRRLRADASTCAAATPRSRPPRRRRTVAARSSSPSRLGKGIVIRPGLPDFSSSLRTNAELAGLLERVWTLLSRP